MRAASRRPTAGPRLPQTAGRGSDRRGRLSETRKTDGKEQRQDATSDPGARHRAGGDSTRRFQRAGRRGRQGDHTEASRSRGPASQPDGRGTRHILQGAGAGSTRAPSPRATGRTDHQPNRGHRAVWTPAPAWALRADNGLREAPPAVRSPWTRSGLGTAGERSMDGGAGADSRGRRLGGQPAVTGCGLSARQRAGPRTAGV